MQIERAAWSENPHDLAGEEAVRDEGLSVPTEETEIGFDESQKVWTRGSSGPTMADGGSHPKLMVDGGAETPKHC